MIELPEARTIAKDLRKEILGKTVAQVRGNFTDHKFTFYYDDPNQYQKQLANKKVTKINDRNFYVEVEIEDYILLMRDGANIRYYNNLQDYPEKSKLLIEFQDGSFIKVTTSMYSFIGARKKAEMHEEKYNDINTDGVTVAAKEFVDKYYGLDVNGVGAFDKEFTLNYFKGLINEKTIKLSTKALLATEQRIPGIGNGVVQDILFNAGMHPKRKINTLTDEDIKKLHSATVATIKNMIDQNGRDTEKDIYGNNGKYKTILSSKTYKNGCPNCQSEIKKEAYLGGSIYYCPKCQK